MVWLASISTICAGLTAAIYVLAVHTTTGRLLDGASFRGAKQSGTAATTAVEHLLDLVSVSSLVISVLAVALIASLRLRRDLVLPAVVLILGSNVTSQLLKHHVLARPDLGIYETTPATLNSLPSGHSTVAFSVAVGLMLVVPAAVRPLAACAGVAYASITALATLSAGWHRPSDSLAAFLIVGAWSAAAEAVVIARGEEPVTHSHAAQGARQFAIIHVKTAYRLAVAAGYLLAFGGLLAGVVVITQLDSYDTAAQVLSYIAGASLISGTAAAIMAALVVPLAEIRPALSSPERPA